LQQEIPISTEDTSETLAPRLASVGADLMIKTLHGLQSGSVHPTPQDNNRASLAPILKREDGLIDFRRSAEETLNRMRGFQPWPGAFTTFRGKQLRVWTAKPAGAVIPPGEISLLQDRLLAGSGSGTALDLLDVQPEGKRRMSARDFIHGYHPRAGEKFGE